MTTPKSESGSKPLSVLFKILALAGVVIAVTSLLVWTIVLGANVVMVLPDIVRAAAKGVEINRPILLPLLLSPLGVLRAVLLLVAARALLKGKPSAQKSAYLYGIVALVTVPVDTYLLYTHGFMSVSTNAAAIAYALVRLLLPLGFIAYAISGTELNRSAQKHSIT